MKKIVLSCLFGVLGFQAYAQDEDKGLHAVCPEKFKFQPNAKGSEKSCKTFGGTSYAPFEKAGDFLKGCRQLPGWAFFSWIEDKPKTVTEYKFIGAYIEKMGTKEDAKYTFWCSYADEKSFKSGHTPSVAVQLTLDTKKYEIISKSDHVAHWSLVTSSHSNAERMRCVDDEDEMSSDDCWVKIKKIESSNP